MGKGSYLCRNGAKVRSPGLAIAFFIDTVHYRANTRGSWREGFPECFEPWKAAI